MKKEKNIILLYGNLRTGGIETLIVRVVKYFVRKKISVTLICEDGPLLNELPLEANTLIYSGTSDLVKKIRCINLNKLLDYTLVTFDPHSAMRGFLVESLTPQITSHISGVFHPRAYFLENSSIFQRILSYQTAKALSFDNLFFMNEECKLSHSNKWKSSLRSSPIIPIPINNVENTWVSKKRSPLRIISVGRLVNFKAYNIGAINIIQNCEISGVPVIWDIFGTGPLQEEIKNKIRENNLDGKINLKGDLSYNDYHNVVSQYDLFIGIGTAALEAAMVGTPVICAVDNEEELCYGFLNEIPFGNVGERQNFPPNKSISRLIINYSSKSKEEQEKISLECRSAALKYDMDTFSEKILNLSSQEEGNKIRKKIFSLLYNGGFKLKSILS